MILGIGNIVEPSSFCHCEESAIVSVAGDEAISGNCFGLPSGPSSQGPSPSGRGRPRNDNRAAFTLVEMLIVLAIMAMIMAISVPFTSGFGKGLKIKTTARAIVGIMRVARSNAVTFRKNYSVVFNVKKGQYWIEDGTGRVYEKKYYLPSSVKFEVKGDEKIDPITFENDRLTFKSSGSIEGSSGSVTITDKQGGSRRISAAETTGKITIN